MTTIRLHAHAFEGWPAQTFEAASVAEWLFAHYGERPGVEVHVYAGEPSRATDLTGDIAALARNDAPLYTVLEAPGIPAAYGVWAVLGNMAISMAVNYAITAIFAKDAKPIENRTQESPNNQLSDRSNRVRVGERVEDIVGTVRSIPSLLMPTYDKYIEHRRVEYALLCIGRGFYDVDDIREGDTLLSQISGASATVYPPFNSPNSGTPQLTIGDPIVDTVLTVSRSSSVEDIVLKALNQVQLPAGAQYFLRGPSAVDTPSGGEVIPESTLDIIWQAEHQRRPNFAAAVEAGQSLTITVALPEDRTFPVTVDGASRTYTTTTPGGFDGVMDGVIVTIDAGGMLLPDNVGTRTVVSHTSTTLTVAELCVDDSSSGTGVVFTLPISHTDTRTVNEVGIGYITLDGASQYPAAPWVSPTAILVAGGPTDWTDWFTLPSTDRTEVWTNVVARGGMYKDDGSKSNASVSYEVQIEQLTALLVPTGVVETMTGTLSGAVSNERAETLERVTSWAGPARVRMRRTTPFDYDFAGFVQDEITWVDLYAVSPVTKPHFGNKTIIHTVTRTTAGSAAISRREFNCLASRKLPTFNGTAFSGEFDSQGGIASGTIAATSRIVDIIAAVTVDPFIGARTIDTIDLAQIWSVQQELDAWNIECGQFNYTFDSDSTSYEETITAIADAAFCRAYRQNGMIRLALDRPQAAAVALFTHRNKKPNAETITRKFASDSDYDGVELAYMDPDTETQETIRLPLDGSWTKLKKVEVSGIRSYEQAWLRANREYQHLRFERLALEVETTTDARALLPNSRINSVDNTQFDTFDGEVIAQDGLEITLSQPVEFEPAQPHSIILKHRDGGIESIAVTAGSAPDRVVLAGPPAEAIVTEQLPDVGVRTEFSFAADSARGAQAWLVREIAPPDANGYVRVRAVNYAPEYYAADEEAIPPRESVIN